MSHKAESLLQGASHAPPYLFFSTWISRERMSGLMKKWLPTVRRSLTATTCRASDKFHIRTRSEFVNDLQVIDPLEIDILNVYRIMDRSGKGTHKYF